MDRVLRTLAILALSIVVGLSSVALLLLTVCGAFRRPDAWAFSVGLAGAAIVVAGLMAIVSLARGFAPAPSDDAGPDERPAAGIVLVEPEAPAPEAITVRAGPETTAFPPPPSAAPREEEPPLTGDEFRWLIGLRIALAIYVLLNLAAAATVIAQFRNLGLGTSWIGPVVRSSLVSMAPAAILLLTLRNPPGRVIPGLVAGMACASLLFRLLMPAFAEGLGLRPMPQPVLRTALLYGLEGAMASLAIGIRWRLERNVDAWMVLATVVFLVFDGLVRIPWHVVR